MTKKKNMMQNNNEEEPTTSSQSDAINTLHKKHKKHKHKKHKRRRGTDQEEEGGSGCGSPSTSEGIKQPALKLKIKIGGQTLGEKRDRQCGEWFSVVKTEIPEPDSDDSTKDDPSNESDVDEEEAWLDALESGRLEEVDEELKKMKDPSLMTARQRALLESKTKEKEEVPPAPLYPQVEMTEEMIQRRLMRAKKRKQQADEKREKDKKQTIERLLKKGDSKIKGIKKLAKKVSQPKITYVANTETAMVCLPPGCEFPLTARPPPQIPTRVTCGVSGCTNLKKYSCSRTGIPLCSLSCYKKNLHVLAILPPQPVT